MPAATRSRVGQRRSDKLGGKISPDDNMDISYIHGLYGGRVSPPLGPDRERQGSWAGLATVRVSRLPPDRGTGANTSLGFR